MTAARKKRAGDVADVEKPPDPEQLRDIARGIDSHASGADKPKRRHLEGFAYWFVIVPCWLVASLTVLLFVDAIEKYIYGDD